jgi:DNA-binding PadR family transcriptional regulator
MPKNISNGAARHMTSKTWLPMVDAGLITARYGQRHYSELPDKLFTITEAGLAVVSQQQKECHDKT